MRIHFSAEDFDDIIEKIHQSEYYNKNGLIYLPISNGQMEDEEESDPAEYFAFQFRVVIPQLGISLREGAICEEYDEEPIVIVYAENEKDHRNIKDIYSNTYITQFLQAYAKNKGITEKIDCYIETEEYEAVLAKDRL